MNPRPDLTRSEWLDRQRAAVSWHLQEAGACEAEAAKHIEAARRITSEIRDGLGLEEPL